MLKTLKIFSCIFNTLCTVVIVINLLLGWNKFQYSVIRLLWKNILHYRIWFHSNFKRILVGHNPPTMPWCCLTLAIWDRPVTEVASTLMAGLMATHMIIATPWRPPCHMPGPRLVLIVHNCAFSALITSPIDWLILPPRFGLNQILHDHWQ